MPAYFVVQGTVTEPTGFVKYAERALPLVRSEGGRFLTMGGEVTVVEGGEWDYAFLNIHEWSDQAAAENFWNSSEYREVKKLRAGKGDFLTIIVAGVADQTQEQLANGAVYIVVQGAVTDPVGFADYVKAVTPLVESKGGRYLVVGGSPNVVEGAWDHSVLVMHEWPNRAAAEGFWNSPEYSEVKKLRAGKGEFLVVIVDGVEHQN